MYTTIITMSDTTAPTPAKPAKKATKPRKPNASAAHPPVMQMVTAAISNLKDRNGSLPYQPQKSSTLQVPYRKDE